MFRNQLCQIFIPGLISLANTVAAADLPDPAKVEPLQLLTVPSYCEGVVFDKEGRGYISWGKSITRFTLDGKHEVWAETGAPNGHKILADGTHLVCDASHLAVLHLTADGKPLPHAATMCDGKPLQGPNDLTLDAANGGFYFTDPGQSSKERPVGSIYYVDSKGTTHLIDTGYAYPNGIALTPDGKKLYVAESQQNRIWIFEVTGPGKASPKKLYANLPVKDAALGQIDNQPDGICLDRAGNLYVAHYGMRQVQVLDPTGKLIARYSGGNLTTSNVAFGGPQADQLFVTGGIGGEDGRGGLYRLDLKVPGLVILPK